MLFLYYSSLVWAQNFSSVKRLCILQKKALRLIHFQKRNTHTSPLFMHSKILKFSDKIALENCILVSKCINKSLPKLFHNWFTFSFESHDHNTRWSELGCLKQPSYRTKCFGRFSTINSAIYSWNYLQKQHKTTLFYRIKTNKLRDILTEFFIGNY